MNVIKSEKRLHKTLHVIKSLPPALSAVAENNDDGIWVWATREIPDSVGDIIRVDGVDLSLYHNPPDTHLKILAQHLTALPDGSAPVVGYADQVVKTITTYKGKLVKGLALYVKWLRDATTTELLPLAAHYKQMVDAGGIDSVSVGMILNDYEQLDTGGLDITKSSLYETSFVTVPCNASANLVKSLEEKLGELLDRKAIESESGKIAEVVPCEIDPEKQAEMPEKQAEPVPAQAAPVNEPDGTKELLRGLLAEELSKAFAPVTDAIRALADAVKQMGDRVDVIESAIVVQTEAKAQASDDQQDEPTDELKSLTKKLDDLLIFMSK